MRDDFCAQAARARGRDRTIHQQAEARLAQPRDGVDASQHGREPFSQSQQQCQRLLSAELIAQLREVGKLDHRDHALVFEAPGAVDQISHAGGEHRVIHQAGGGVDFVELRDAQSVVAFFLAAPGEHEPARAQSQCQGQQFNRKRWLKRGEPRNARAELQGQTQRQRRQGEQEVSAAAIAAVP